MLDEDDDESLCEVQDLSQTLNLVLLFSQGSRKVSG